MTRKIKAIARFFIHDFICTRPVHGSCRVGGVLIFISEIRSWFSTRFSGIAPEDRRDLLTVHRIGSSKPTVVAAGDDAILMRPENRVCVSDAIRDIGERIFGGDGRRTRHAIQDSRQHRAGQGCVRRKCCPPHTDHDSMVPAVYRRFRIPCVGATSVKPVSSGAMAGAAGPSSMIAANRNANNDFFIFYFLSSLI